MKDITKEVLFELIRISITKQTENIPSDVSWADVINLATDQGVLGLCFDAIDLLPLEQRPDIDNLMEWLGQVSYMETTYAEHTKIIKDLAEFYSSIDVRMMLLKGYGLSLCWPKPTHRPVGDIDSYLYGKWQEADKLLTAKLGVVVDNGHHHHSVFTYKGTMVENHYDFLNVHSHTSNKWIEEMFKNMACGGYEVPDSSIENLYYPSATLNAMYVARHAACHFASERMTMRQLLDWAFLVSKYHRQIDWNMFWQNIKQMGMAEFVLCINEVCIKYLGFDDSMFHTPYNLHCDDCLSAKMLDDIFEPEDLGLELHGIKYTKHRFVLWWRNRWKHKMVYSDSLISTFFVQIRSHLMKPQTIFGE